MLFYTSCGCFRIVMPTARTTTTPVQIFLLCHGRRHAFQHLNVSGVPGDTYDRRRFLNISLDPTHASDVVHDLEYDTPLPLHVARSRARCVLCVFCPSEFPYVVVVPQPRRRMMRRFQTNHAFWGKVWNLLTPGGFLLFQAELEWTQDPRFAHCTPRAISALDLFHRRVEYVTWRGHTVHARHVSDDARRSALEAWERDDEPRRGVLEPKVSLSKVDALLRDLRKTWGFEVLYCFLNGSPTVEVHAGYVVPMKRRRDHFGGPDPPPKLVREFSTRFDIDLRTFNDAHHKRIIILQKPIPTTAALPHRYYREHRELRE